MARIGNRSTAVAVVLGWLLVSVGLAQNSAALEREFEGSHVELLIDMPADSDGVDIWPQREIPVDFSKVGDRLRRFGVALRKGDSVMVTKIRVKKKLIEFQLGGGGYSGGAGAPYISTSVPKSSREKDLDDLVDEETDERRKDRLKSERDRLRDRRRREEARLRAEAAQAKELAELREREVRASSGSRFNLRFDGPVPDEFLSPEGLADALAEYVVVSDGGAEAGRRPPLVSDFPLRKGVRPSEVERIFGQSNSCTTEIAAGLKVKRCVYELDEADLTVRYVGEVVVKYVLESR